MIQYLFFGILALLMIGLNVVRPNKGVAVVLFGALVVTGMTSYYMPSWSYIAWVVSIASFSLIFPSLLLLGRGKYQKGNMLSYAMLMFFTFCILSLIIHYSEIEEAFAAGKNIFQFWSLPLLAYVGIVDRKVKTNISKLILIFAIIQIPVSLHQYFFMINWAERIAGGDSVVGTFGGSAEGGGNSGAQTTFLVIIWTYIVAIYIHLKKVRTFWFMASFFLLIPVLLNETKIFLFYLPIVIVQLFLSFIKPRPVRTILVSSLMGVAGFGVLVFYFLYLQHTAYGVSESKDLESYISQKTGSTSGLSLETHEEIGLTRLGSIIYWWDEHSMKHDSTEMLLGHGLGASKGSGVYLGHLYKVYKYKNLRLDRTGLSKFLWDVGIIGTILFMMVFIAAYFILVKAQYRQESNSIETALIISAKIGITILLIGNIYDTYLIRNQGLNILFSCLLAYTFYINRDTLLQKVLRNRSNTPESAGQVLEQRP